jgi:hypothetical protein
LNLMLQHGGESVDLDTYTSMSLYQLTSILDVNLSSQPEDISVGGVPGKAVQYKMDTPEHGSMTFYQGWTVAHGFAFVLTLSAPTAEAGPLIKLAQESVSAFTWLPEAPTLLASHAAAAVSAAKSDGDGKGGRAIQLLFCNPIHRPGQRFVAYTPTGWQLQQEDGPRVLHAVYKGTLSAAPEEPVVLLSFSVTMEHKCASLDALTSAIQGRLAHLLGAQAADVAVESTTVSGLPGARISFASRALIVDAPNPLDTPHFTLTWTVDTASSTGYVLTAASSAPAADRRADPLFARLTESFRLVPAAYEPAHASRRYEHLEYGVRIDYPAHFSVVEDFLGATVAFVREAAGSFGSHVNFVCYDRSEVSLGGSLDEFTDVIKAQLEYIKNCEIDDDTVDTLGGVDAKRLVYRGQVSSFSVKFHQVYALRGDKAYILCFAAEQDSFDAEFSFVKEICFDNFTFFNTSGQ